MIEGVVSIVTAIVESLITLAGSLIELIAGFFVGAGETLAATDTFLLLFVFIFEIIFWIILWIKELLVSLFKLRKPRPITKPVFWRPKPKVKVKN